MNEITSLMFDEYEVYYCEKCKIYIYYFKSNKCFEGYHCWKCVWDAGKEKRDELNRLVLRKYFNDHPFF